MSCLLLHPGIRCRACMYLPPPPPLPSPQSAIISIKPWAMAVLPVPGWPAMRMARPAILPSRIISRTTPAARRAAAWPTRPCDTCRASIVSLRAQRESPPLPTVCSKPCAPPACRQGRDRGCASERLAHRSKAPRGSTRMGLAHTPQVSTRSSTAPPPPKHHPSHGSKQKTVATHWCSAAALPPHAQPASSPMRSILVTSCVSSILMSAAA